MWKSDRLYMANKANIKYYIWVTEWKLSFLRRWEDINFYLHHFRWNIFRYLHEANSQLQFFSHKFFLLAQEYMHPFLWHKLWCTYMNCNYQFYDKNRPIFMPSKCSQSLNYIKHILLHSQLEMWKSGILCYLVPVRRI